MPGEGLQAELPAWQTNGQTSWPGYPVGRGEQYEVRQGSANLLKNAGHSGGYEQDVIHTCGHCARQR